MEKTNQVKVINGSVQQNDWVMAVDNNDYAGLIGTVIAIEKLGTPEHGTDNETDDVHVDFTAFDYSPKRIAAIEEHFSRLYDEKLSFDEISLDDVIMAPMMLISLSNLSHEEITRMGNHGESFDLLQGTKTLL